MVLHMNQNSLQMIHLQSATYALLLLTGPHHEVLDEELTAAVKQLRQR